MDSDTNPPVRRSLRITAIRRAIHPSPHPQESDSHEEWRSSSPPRPSTRENTIESAAKQLGQDQPTQERAMIFLLRSSSATKGTVPRTQKCLRATCAQVRAQWVEQFGQLKSRSLRMPVVQSARRRLSAKYGRQLHLFVMVGVFQIDENDPRLRA
jgi:hypothetical protein